MHLNVNLKISYKSLDYFNMDYSFKRLLYCQCG